MASSLTLNRPDTYTPTAMALHWLIALLIICGFSLG